jgi:hypothetical protein
VKGIQSEDEIENFQDKGLKYNKCSKMILKCGKINRYREQVRKVLSEVK